MHCTEKVEGNPDAAFQISGTEASVADDIRSPGVRRFIMVGLWNLSKLRKSKIYCGL
jgi:hypothetical protein